MLLHHNLSKIQLRQPKVVKTERATGNNTCDKRCILYIHIAGTRKGVTVVKWRRSVM